MATSNTQNPPPSPNLFIAGAAKAGTTTLWEYLKQHPDVFMPEDEIDKEPGYFAEATKPGGRKLSLEKYLQLFEEAGQSHKWIGEASTVYLPDPTSAQKIHEFNPQARIIIMLRNPVDRAYSHYNWMVQEGYEHASSFEKALQLEQKRKKKKIPNFWEPELYYDFLYFESGLYSQQVQRYLHLFGENVLLLQFQTLKEQPQKVYSSLCDFLNLSPLDHFEYKAYNISRQVISPKLQFMLRKFTVFMDKFGNVINKPFSTKEKRDALLRLGLKNTPPPPLSNNLKQNLLKKYEGDIRELTSMGGIDFTYWLKE